MTAAAARCQVERTPDGHLRLAAGDAARFFPDAAFVAAVFTHFLFDNAAP